MMNYASVYAMSILVVLLSIIGISNINISPQQYMDNCHKIKEKIPQININCAEYRSKKRSSFIELNQSEAANKDSKEITESKENFLNETELNSFDSIEHILDNISENVVNISEEFRLFKNSFLKNKIKSSNALKDQKVKDTLIASHQSLNNRTSKDEKSKEKLKESKEDSQSVLKMKTFNDLQLDLNLLTVNKKERKNEDLINLLNSKLKQNYNSKK